MSDTPAPRRAKNGSNAMERYSADQVRRARALLGRLTGARQAARFYPPGHPAFDLDIAKLETIARSYLDEDVPIQLGFVDGEILLGEQLLAEESVTHARLTEELAALGVGSLTIEPGATADEIGAAMRVLGMDADALAREGGLAEVVAGLELPHVTIGAMRIVERERADRFRLPASARAAFRESVALVHDLDRVVDGDAEVDSDAIDAAVRSLVDNVLNNRDAMVQLAGVRNHDEYTYQHSANVAALSLALGSMISTDEDFLASLGVGALLHDVGKLSVDREIINKSGALTPDEWAQMRRHPVEGAEVVSSLPGIDQGAVVVIAEHHMRYDGAGYPQRRTPHPQHLQSRIVAVADAYDAMTSRRSYSAARLPDEAMALLVDSAGTATDPALVRLFVRLMGVYPPRSIVQLADGEIGIVIAANATEPARPVVRVVSSASGEVVEPVDIDLSEDRERSIRACLDPRSVNIDVDTYLT